MNNNEVNLRWVWQILSYVPLLFLFNTTPGIKSKMKFFEKKVKSNLNRIIFIKQREYIILVWKQHIIVKINTAY